MTLKWRPTSLPTARSRTDDVFFLDALQGWAVNSDGKVFKTTDGAYTWIEQYCFEDSYLRCISFASPSKGWLGSLSGPHALYSTEDGGNTWTPVTGLPASAPERICGLIAVNENVIFAAGTNFPNEVAGVVRSVDGGQNWTVLTLDPAPALLVDIHFEDANTGWVVGAVDDVDHPDRGTIRRDVIPAVYATADGGKTWTNVVAGLATEGQFPRGEWGWKVQRFGATTLFVSTQNFLDGAILRSDDLGATWIRLKINDRQRNANLEGIGFIDGQHGWVGGWGDLFFQGGFTSETRDGGQTWEDANEVGFRLNRFRFVGDPVTVGYASGDTVYKLSSEPVPENMAATLAGPEQSDPDRVSFDIEVPENAGRLEMLAWDRFGALVRRMHIESNPAPGPRKVTWNFTSDDGEALPTGSFIVRFIHDAGTMSEVVHRINPSST